MYIDLGEIRDINTNVCSSGCWVVVKLWSVEKATVVNIIYSEENELVTMTNKEIEPTFGGGSDNLMSSVMPSCMLSDLHFQQKRFFLSSPPINTCPTDYNANDTLYFFLLQFYLMSRKCCMICFCFFFNSFKVVEF